MHIQRHPIIPALIHILSVIRAAMVIMKTVMAISGGVVKIQLQKQPIAQVIIHIVSVLIMQAATKHI